MQKTDRYYYYFHFTDGETEAPRGDGKDPGLPNDVARIGTLNLMPSP